MDLVRLDEVSHVAVLGDHAYVADRHGGLQVIDVSVPSAPVVVAALTELDYAGGVAVIASILGILVFLVIEVLPLFAAARVLTGDHQPAISQVRPNAAASRPADLPDGYGKRCVIVNPLEKYIIA